MHINNELLQSNLVKVLGIVRLALESKNIIVRENRSLGQSLISRFISATVIIAPTKAEI